MKGELKRISEGETGPRAKDRPRYSREGLPPRPAGAVLPPHQPRTELSRQLRFPLAGAIGAALVRLWGATWRMEWDLPESILALEREGRPLIHTFWHAQILSLAYAYRGRRVVVLVSQHGDGEYISQVIHRLGLGTVRGSSSRGGLRSLLEMGRLGKSGYSLAVTPDGPRGPRHRLQAGVLLIASRSGIPIMPLAAVARRRRVLGSWDRFELPHPFSRMLVAAGEPIWIPPDVSAETMEAHYGPLVEKALLELGERAERWAGRSPAPEPRP